MYAHSRVPLEKLRATQPVSVNVHCRVHDVLPLVPVLTNINPVNDLATYFFMIPVNTVLPPSKWALFFCYSTKNFYAFLFSPSRATCAVYLSLLDLTAPIIYDERYTSCSFPPLILLLFGSNILSILLSNTICLCSCFTVTEQVSHPYKTAF
jgi:hypothetical protein